MSNLDLNRLPLPYGILIDRNQPVTFQFDQQTFQISPFLVRLYF